METLQGKLLIAVPGLADSNFFRSVVLILQHHDDGALGLVLNRPTNMNIQDIWNAMSDNETELHGSIYSGGPVQGPLMALHSNLSQAEESVIPGVFYSIRREQINSLMESAADPLRLYSGNSGWGPGQLEGEIEAGGWFVMPAEYDHVFGPDDELWKSVCEQYGTEIVIDEKFRFLIPQDPSTN